MSDRARVLAGGKLRLDHPAPHVARLTIDHPAKRNALDHDILDALTQSVPEIEARCLLITAVGPAFSAGYDIAGLPRSSRFADRAGALVTHRFASAVAAVEAFPYPTLAALNGHAIGGGLELALSCDLRLAAQGIKVGMPPAKLGLIYSHTGLQKFLEAIGAPRTRELFHRGRNVDVSQALAWGLVNEVVEPDELASAAVDYAAEIAANAPLVLKGTKGVLRELLAARGRLDPEIEQELIALRESCFHSEDLQEGIRAFAEKRAPAWKAR